MWVNTFFKILESNGLQNLLIIISLVIALFIGIRQVWLNDVVELYVNYNPQTNRIHVQNVGTRLIYLDKYIFNGRTYPLEGQILPSTYAQADGGAYVIDMPGSANSENHVSLEVFYHDLDKRHWYSMVIADRDGTIWKVKTFPRKAGHKQPIQV